MPMFWLNTHKIQKKLGDLLECLEKLHFLVKCGQSGTKMNSRKLQPGSQQAKLSGASLPEAQGHSGARGCLRKENNVGPSECSTLRKHCSWQSCCCLVSPDSS